MRDLVDTTEMYLRTVFDLEEEGIPPLRARIVERLGHSGPTVSQTVGRMERDGLLTLADDRRIELTELGRLRATQVTRKHRIAERLLSDVIGLDLEYIHDEACRWEHVMSERVERKILEMLPEHAESPYGMPIPGLDEFGEAESSDFRKGLVTLIEAAPEEGSDIRATLRRIAESAQFDQDTLSLITATGLLPGEVARVRREGERIIVARADGAENDGVSLPLDVAVHVFVEVND